jgi:hypothetical protein
MSGEQQAARGHRIARTAAGAPLVVLLVRLEVLHDRSRKSAATALGAGVPHGLSLFDQAPVRLHARSL